MMRLATGPDEKAFVLLDDARVHGAVPARLFRDPAQVLTAASAIAALAFCYPAGGFRK